MSNKLTKSDAELAAILEWHTNPAARVGWANCELYTKHRAKVLTGEVIAGGANALPSKPITQKPATARPIEPAANASGWDWRMYAGAIAEWEYEHETWRIRGQDRENYVARRKVEILREHEASGKRLSR